MFEFSTKVESWCNIEGKISLTNMEFRNGL